MRRVNPDGNERLTAAVGVLLLVPVAAEVGTVLLGVHTFMSWHVFVGLALIPVIVLKLASTGWRFVRYYTRSPAYVEHGPPQLAMRLLAPLFVVATVVLFGSGVAMGLLHGQSLQLARRLHGPASVIWLLLLGVHVLVYLGRALRRTADDVLPVERRPVRGKTARLYGLSIAIVGGLLLGAALVPAQHRWVNIRHDHEGNDAQSNARNRPSSQEQAQRPQFSTTGSAIPIAAAWTRRIDPPCVTTRTRWSPGWRSAIRRNAPSIRSWCASVDSPTNSTRSRSTAFSPSQLPQSFSRRSGSSSTGSASRSPTISAVSRARERSLE
jgi:hypothetical protein